MNVSAAVHLNRSDLPGWYGKLPGMGDFAQRRLPEQFRSVWDNWLQAGLFELQSRQPDWVERYLESPVWFFVLGPQLAGPSAWLGVMMPSVDSAGRYFPLTLAIELAGRQGAADWAREWWELSAQVAIAALESDLDANRFELALQEAFGGNATGASMPAGAALQLPSAGQSVWRVHPGDESPPSMVWSGLPRAASFDALFGCGADRARASEASR